MHIYMHTYIQMDVCKNTYLQDIHRNQDKQTLTDFITLLFETLAFEAIIGYLFNQPFNPGLPSSPGEPRSPCSPLRPAPNDGRPGNPFGPSRPFSPGSPFAPEKQNYRSLQIAVRCSWAAGSRYYLLNIGVFNMQFIFFGPWPLIRNTCLYLEPEYGGIHQFSRQTRKIFYWWGTTCGQWATFVAEHNLYYSAVDHKLCRFGDVVNPGILFFNDTVPYQKWLASQSSCIHTWDWYCQSANSGGVNPAFKVSCYIAIRILLHTLMGFQFLITFTIL